MNALLTVSSFLFPLITYPYVSRVLQPLGTGKVSFALSVVAYFAMFAELGIPIYGIRAVAKVRDNKKELTKVVQELLLISLITTFISYILFFSAVFFIPKLSSEKPLFLIVGMTMILNTLGMDWLYKGLEEYTYITVRSLICKVISVAAMFMLIHTSNDYVQYGAICIFASSASNILNLINAHKYVSFKPVWNYHLSKHIKAVLIFLAMSCATIIYTNVNNVMLGFMTTDIDVGYYDAANKIKIILVSVVTSLGAVLLPRCSYYVEHKMKEEFYRVSKKAINFVIISALPIVVYFILFAKEGIICLAGGAFKESIIPMQILMPTVLFIGLTNILGMQWLVPLGKEKIVLYSVITGAVVDVILIFLLIPPFHAIGAAIGTLGAELSVLIVQIYSLRKLVLKIFKKVKYFKILLCVAAASGASILIKFLSIGNFVTLLVSAIVFFAVYIVLLVALKEPLMIEIINQVTTKLKMRRRSLIG